ncbi:immunoglobulin-like and fibronectin type III domain-containing protein 1 [Siniperca chuatsi]|uniref:immunoglobulin-like and fibronectin type III domain-containing protein 1 n=1 Tax=Siniperca chuatsi TaxID=119488 RepID=UPI001CE209E0|nr:immunoglobulin-like and fibronectin type III domain-containing protein 1 [Siniperca chuatsi]
MLNADRKDYERICTEFGIADLHLILKKLEEKKKERVQNKCKDGVIPSDEDATEKHSLKSAGRTKDSSTKGLMQKDTGLHQVDEEVNLLFTEFKLSNVDFVIKIQEVKAQEREDALFECVLTHPLPRITWMGKGSILEDGEKYSITVSNHKLIHRLLINDCKQLDKGIYSAVAGITSCSAWLVVEAESDRASAGKKIARKTTLAGGARTDLEKVAKEQQIKIREEMEKILAAVKSKHDERLDGEINAVTGPGKNSGAVKDKPPAAKASTLSEPTGSKGKAKSKNARGDGTVPKLDVSGCVTKEVPLVGNDPNNKKHNRSGQADFDKVTDTNEGGNSEENDDFTGSANNSRHIKHGRETKHTEIESSGTNVDAELNQIPIFATSQNEVTDSDGNKDSTGSVRCPRHTRKVQGKQHTSESSGTNVDAELNQIPIFATSQNEVTDSDGNKDSTGSVRCPRHTRKVQGKQHTSDPNELARDNEGSDSDKNEDSTGQVKNSSCSKQSQQPQKAVNGESAGPKDHNHCDETKAATGSGTHSRRKRQGPLIEDMVIDPGVQFVCGLSDVSAIINETAELSCKLSSEDCEGAWFRDGKKISPDDNFTLTKDGAIHKLVIIRCKEEHSGKYRFEADGRKTEALINIKDPPRFDPENLSAFTEPVTVKVGHNAIFKLHFVGHEPIKIQWYKEGEELQDDNNTKIEKSASHSRLLLSRCQRKDTGEIKIKLKNEHGFIEAISQLIVLAFPGPPGPPKVVSACDDCINISWTSPSNRGGSRILGYILEKRKNGSNLWTVVNAMDELIKEKKYAVKDVVAGLEYEFRVTAINLSGAGEFSSPSEFVFARDPKKPPGKVTSLKVTETSYTHLVLTWTKPKEKPGIQDEAKGYFVEIRQAECIEWSRCNTTPIITTTFSVKGLKSMDMYWVRVIATNDGGESAPEELANYILAMPSPVRPKFTNHKMKSFMVVRAGNSVRITVNFEASPWPDIMWLKDNVPVTKRVTISNSDGSSQLLIPSSERSDSGIYSIIVKNLAGQETFSTEIRVTDDPKPPGPVELEENVPGTVTVIWEPSPDEKRDDRLHYTVSKLDSKRTWTTVAERLFNNKFTVCNIMHGREYNFRVYAKNDIGISAPSESPTWGMEKKKEKFVVSVPTRKDCDLRCAPTFIVPLKLHTAPKGYECYMSCAVKGNPKPRVTWYRNHISLNINTNYYISDTCGVCSMLILHVGPKDMGEYTITAENALGRAECSTILSVRE